MEKCEKLSFFNKLSSFFLFERSGVLNPIMKICLTTALTNLYI